jgi:hypothetical protein
MNLQLFLANQSDNNDSSDNGGMVDRSSEYGNFLQSSNVIVPPTGETHLMFCRYNNLFTNLLIFITSMCGYVIEWFQLYRD